MGYQPGRNLEGSERLEPDNPVNGSWVIWGRRKTTMAKKSPPGDGTTDGTWSDGGGGANSPFTGSLTNTQLADEVGRCLQSWSQAVLSEPLPEDLAALVRKLEERESGISPPDQS
jgi:hypothetical protein